MYYITYHILYVLHHFIWRLGALQRVLTFTIFIKIIVVDIFYYNDHLKPFPVHGVVHTQMQQPTQDRCVITERGCNTNLKPMSQLPYCQQSKSGKGNATAARRRLHEANHSMVSEGKVPSRVEDAEEAFKDDLPASATRVQLCEYWDAVKMAQTAPSVLNALFVPTRIEVIPQEKGCEPSDENGWSCDSLPFVDVEDTSSAPPPMFVANVEDLQLYLISMHSTLH